eukprot:3812478-Amphidinium_carterae.1
MKAVSISSCQPNNLPFQVSPRPALTEHALWATHLVFGPLLEAGRPLSSTQRKCFGSSLFAGPSGRQLLRTS